MYVCFRVDLGVLVLDMTRERERERMRERNGKVGKRVGSCIFPESSE